MHNSWCKYLWEQLIVFTDFSAKSSLIMTVVGRIDRGFGNLSGKYNQIQNPSLPDIEAKLTLNEFRRSKKCSKWRCLKCTKNSFILKSRIVISVKNFFRRKSSFVNQFTRVVPSCAMLEWLNVGYTWFKINIMTAGFTFIVIKNTSREVNKISLKEN